jgi:hypothetical protein
MNIPLKCQCGSLRGVAIDISPSKGNRLTCMCDTCQTYAHHLGQAEKILDKYGGTDIFQMTPSELTITEGIEHLRCLQLEGRGVLRWYAGCCNTPVANTLSSAKVPFVGVPHTFMDHAGHRRTREQDLGPLLARTMGEHGIGELPSDAYSSTPLSVIFRSLYLLILAWLKGKHEPSPFFDADTGKPIFKPELVYKNKNDTNSF